jgi:hypothetical protein
MDGALELVRKIVLSGASQGLFGTLSIGDGTTLCAREIEIVPEGKPDLPPQECPVS